MFTRELQAFRETIAGDASSIDFAAFRARGLDRLDALIVDREMAVDDASRDSATGLRNRRYFDARLAGERAAAPSAPLALVRVDAQGDLAAIGRGLLDASADFAGTPCRIGESSFAIILPQTDAAMAQDVVRRTSDVFAELRAERFVTVYSFGSAAIERDVDSSTDLMTAAVPAAEPARPRGTRFTGRILDVTGTTIVQDAGRGATVDHPISAFETLPERDAVVQIAYDANGRATVDRQDVEPPQLSR